MLKDFANSLAQQIKDKLDNTTGFEEKADLTQSKLKEMIQMGLRRCELVTREEFDAQAAVLQKTRAKLEELELQLEDLRKNSRQ